MIGTKLKKLRERFDSHMRINGDGDVVYRTNHIIDGEVVPNWNNVIQDEESYDGTLMK